MKKRNILFVTSAETTGGAERTLILILQNLNRDLFSPTVLLPKEGMLSDELKKMDTPIVTSRLIRKLNLLKMSFSIGGIRFYNPFTMIINALCVSFYFLSSILIIITIALRVKIDMLHVNSSDIAARLFLASSVVRKPVIFHAHDILWPTLDNILLHWLIDVPVITMCTSNAIRRPLLASSKNIDNIRTIYSGIDLHVFDGRSDVIEIEKLRKKLHLHKVVVGIVGRFDLSKGHETFLEAASIASKTFGGVSFLVVGTWLLEFERLREEYLKQYAQNVGLKDSVVFTGFVDNIKNYYDLMDVVVVPSWEEAFGLVHLEAFASKRPVIASNSGGAPELIEDGVSGLLVPPKDPVALAAAMVRLFKDTDLQEKLSTRGLKIIEEGYFGTQRFMNDIEGVYREAAGIH